MSYPNFNYSAAVEHWSKILEGLGWEPINQRLRPDDVAEYSVHDFEVHLFPMGSHFIVHYHPNGLRNEAAARSEWNIDRYQDEDVEHFFKALADPKLLPTCIDLEFAKPIIERWAKDQ